MLRSSRVITLAAGESVFDRSDPSDGIYCVMSGAVCFGGVAASGKGSIIALAEPPQWFGEIRLFDGGTRTHDARADVASTLPHLPSRHLGRILAEDRGRWQPMGRLLVHKLRIALALLEDIALEPPKVRLARCLINLLEGYGQRKGVPSCSVRVSQERLGMTHSTSQPPPWCWIGVRVRRALEIGLGTATPACGASSRPHPPCGFQRTASRVDFSL